MAHQGRSLQRSDTKELPSAPCGGPSRARWLLFDRGEGVLRFGRCDERTVSAPDRRQEEDSRVAVYRGGKRTIGLLEKLEHNDLDKTQLLTKN
ncbi:hypothetical protein GN956_G5180 [Arapaima gigas]